MSRVVVVDSTSLHDRGEVALPSIDSDNATGSAIRQADLQVLVTTSEDNLVAHADAIQKAAASPLVRSLMILTEPSSNYSADGATEQVDRKANSFVGAPDILPTLTRPAGLSKIPILWVPDYVGLACDQTGRVQAVGAIDHTAQNRGMLLTVLTSVDVFDLLHAKMQEIPSLVAVPQVVLSHDSRLAGDQIAFLTDSIIMAIFGGLPAIHEFWSVLESSDPTEANRALTVFERGRSTNQTTEQQSADDENEEPRAGNRQQSERAASNIPSADARYAALKSGNIPMSAEQSDTVDIDVLNLLAVVEDLRQQRRQAVDDLRSEENEADEDDEDDDDEHEEPSDGDQTPTDDQGTDKTANDKTRAGKGDSTGGTQAATKARQATAKARQSAQKRLKSFTRKQAAPLIGGGLLLGAVSLLAPVAVLLIGTAAAATMVGAGGYGVNQNQKRKKRRAKRRKQKRFEERPIEAAAAEEQPVPDVVLELEQAERLQQITGLLHEMVRKGLVERNGKRLDLSPSILQYDPRSQRSGLSELTDRQQSITMDLLYRHLVAIIWPMMFALLEIDEDGGLEIDEVLRTWIDHPTDDYRDRLDPLAPSHPPLVDDSKVLDLDRVTQRRLVETINNGRVQAGSQVRDEILRVVRLILNQRDTIVSFGLLHALRASEADKADLEVELHRHIIASTEEIEVSFTFDPWNAFLHDCLLGTREPTYLCGLEHLPIVDRSIMATPIAHARTSVRKSMQSVSGDFQYLNAGADVDGLLGIKPIVAGAVEEPDEAWAISHAIEALCRIRGVPMTIAPAAEDALVADLNRFRLISGIDHLIERLTQRNAKPSIGLAVQGTTVVLTVDGTEVLDGEFLERYWPDLFRMIDRTGSAGPGKRLVFVMPLVTSHDDEEVVV